MIRTHNARQGFVEPGLFETIANHLPSPLDDVARLAYLAGWRKNELLPLEWTDVDRPNHRASMAGALLELIATAETPGR